MGLDADRWDYIIIGAGSAGCVLANRLSANPDCRVLLLEAGGSDKSVFIQMPAATYVNAIGNPKFDWRYAVEPDPTLGGRGNIWPRGKVMGGTSSINGTLYVRGLPEDYDGWKALGNLGWGWADVLPLFKRHEDNENGASEFHGAGGAVSIANLDDPHPIARSFLEAGARRGYPRLDDINGLVPDGLSYVQSTRRKGWRCSAARAFVDPVRSRRNLRVATHSVARRILFEGRTAFGVEADVAGSIVTLRANREVIVSAGAIASPQLLLLSGIGNANELGRFGIPLVAHSPEVGRNLQDHPGLAMTYASHVPTFNDEMALWRRALHGANWLFRGKGVGTTPDAHVVGFIRSVDREVLPDIQVHVTPAGYLVAGEGDLILKESSFTVIASVCRPASRGEIRLGSADPGQPPIIDHRLFGDEDDLKRLAAGVRRLREIVEVEPLATIVARPIEPPWSDVSDETVEAYLRANATTIYHPSGTCRMGVDATAVVSPDLRVNGVDRLRVADASVMPKVTSGNLNAPCMMIGEKASSLILGNRRPEAA